MLIAVADLDGDNTDMPVWFQVFFVGIIVVIICFTVWTFVPARKKHERGPSGLSSSSENEAGETEH